MIDCPNCITPWKCNGPHLEKSWDGIYKSTDGYYILNRPDIRYKFIPNEKEYSEDNLLDIYNTLKTLNETLNQH